MPLPPADPAEEEADGVDAQPASSRAAVATVAASAVTRRPVVVVRMVIRVLQVWWWSGGYAVDRQVEAFGVEGDASGDRDHVGRRVAVRPCDVLERAIGGAPVPGGAALVRALGDRGARYESVEAHVFRREVV